MNTKISSLLTLSAKAATPLALLVSSALIWNATSAAFTTNTTNATNTWESGAVTLTDDDANTAMFAVTGLVPGATGSKCIVVTYTSAVSAAEIRVYGTGTGTMAPHLNLTIEEGTGGSFSDCTGFAASGTIFNDTLTAWNGKNNFTNGVGAHAVTAGAAQNITYKVTYTLANTTAAQSKSGAANFTWESVTP